MSASEDIIYGRYPVLEALRSDRDVEKVVLVRGTRWTGVLAEIAAEARRLGVPVQALDKAALDRLADGAHHQGAVAHVSVYRYAELDDVLATPAQRGEPAFLLLLDCVQDPQNLASLLRTAEAVGVHGVILPEHRAVGVTGAVVKASAGAVEHLTIARVTNLVRAMEQLQTADIWVLGLERTPQSQRYDRVDLTMPLAWVVGSEGRGLSRLVRERCDLLVDLPMRGRVNSLNAAAAGSIALYQTWLRRYGNP
ncbi:MAG: 23S rRNA (guanosine(2251)-2'-O)-methyltransferase RlmB [Chloroflexi bacterium]|nr:23S rRNA (guanosine(2251)-2'-O)-methyltransferase RlmB [Chloroflexota bacterium]MBU1749177.1 23S rRNA (guanosine(2251)-2'-O)-methyltransferase RlmB [Chloroflexota bacterium]